MADPREWQAQPFTELPLERCASFGMHHSLMHFPSRHQNAEEMCTWAFRFNETKPYCFITCIFR